MTNDKEKARVLAECLDQIERGILSIDQCLELFPEYRKEIEPLLRLAAELEPFSVKPSDDFKAATRSMLKHEVENDWLRRVMSVRRLFGRLALAGRSVFALITVGVTFLGSGTIYAAQGSLPGDALYPVKTGTENIRYWLAPGEAERAELLIMRAERRLDEIAAKASVGRNIDDESLAEAGREIDSAVQWCNGLPVGVRDQALERLSKIASQKETILKTVAAYSACESSRTVLEEAVVTAQRSQVVARVAGQLQGIPSVLDNRLVPFQVSGILVSAEGQTWNVGGIFLESISVAPDAPVPGTRVTVQGLTRSGEVLIGSVTGAPASSYVSVIRGVFTGELSGNLWTVSGIQVKAPAKLAVPALGAATEIEGFLQDGSFVPGQPPLDKDNSRDGTVQSSGSENSPVSPESGDAGTGGSSGGDSGQHDHHHDSDEEED